MCMYHRVTEYTYRVEMANFCHSCHHDEKISPVLGGGGGRGARPSPFTLVTITYKVVVYTPAERSDTLPLFHLYTYMYSVVCTILHNIQYV
jgi:hypothetical protein